MTTLSILNKFVGFVFTIMLDDGRSMTVLMSFPGPIHIVATPRAPSLRRTTISKVTVMRQFKPQPVNEVSVFNSERASTEISGYKPGSYTNVRHMWKKKRQDQSEKTKGSREAQAEEDSSDLNPRNDCPSNKVWPRYGRFGVYRVSVRLFWTVGDQKGV